MVASLPQQSARDFFFFLLLFKLHKIFFFLLPPLQTKMTNVFKWAVERGQKALQYGKYYVMMDEVRRNPKQLELVTSRMKEIEQLFYHDKEPIYCESVSAVEGAKYLKGKHGWRGETITFHPQNPYKDDIIKRAKELELESGETKDLKEVDNKKSDAGPSGSERDGK